MALTESALTDESAALGRVDQIEDVIGRYRLSFNRTQAVERARVRRDAEQTRVAEEKRQARARRRVERLKKQRVDMADKIIAGLDPLLAEIVAYLEANSDLGEAASAAGIDHDQVDRTRLAQHVHARLHQVFPYGGGFERGDPQDWKPFGDTERSFLGMKTDQ